MNEKTLPWGKHHTCFGGLYPPCLLRVLFPGVPGCKAVARINSYCQASLIRKQLPRMKFPSLSNFPMNSQTFPDGLKLSFLDIRMWRVKANPVRTLAGVLRVGTFKAQAHSLHWGSHRHHGPMHCFPFLPPIVWRTVSPPGQWGRFQAEALQPLWAGKGLVLSQERDSLPGDLLIPSLSRREKREGRENKIRSTSFFSISPPQVSDFLNWNWRFAFFCLCPKPIPFFTVALEGTHKHCLIVTPSVIELWP